MSIYQFYFIYIYIYIYIYIFYLFGEHRLTCAYSIIISAIQR